MKYLNKIVYIIIIADLILLGIYFSYLAKNRSDIRKLFAVKSFNRTEDR